MPLVQSVERLLSAVGPVRRLLSAVGPVGRLLSAVGPVGRLLSAVGPVSREVVEWPVGRLLVPLVSREVVECRWSSQ